jgi:hypothetical protein
MFTAVKIRQVDLEEELDMLDMDKVMMAAEKYLIATGRNVLGKIEDDNIIIFKDESDIAIANVYATISSIKDAEELPVKMARKEFESIISEVVAEGELDTLGHFRYDTIELFIVRNDRGIIRHHLDAGIVE